MGKVFLAFLGTNDYLPCNYQYEGLGTIENVRFIQEAIIQLFCQDWTSEDKALIFLTPDARLKNWQDDGHFRNNVQLKREGLKRRLEKLNLPLKVIDIDIPIGKSESEIWEIFEAIFKNIQENDEVIFDITHAFRSIPMLAIIALNYARILKSIKILGVFYGAFEALGNFRQAAQIPLKDRTAPILNLTSFIGLFEWTNVLNYFLNSGDASLILEKTKEDTQPILKETKGKHESASNIKKFCNKLNYLTELIRTCRGYALITYDFNELRQYLQKNQGSIIRPLNPLLEKISLKLKDFKTNSISNGYNAVKWCIDHNLIQQGFTLLQETLISELVARFFSEDQILKKNKRRIITQALIIKAKSTPKEKWQIPLDIENKEEWENNIQRILSEISPELTTLYSQITEYRNDMNHAGFRENALVPKKFRESLIESYNQLTKLRIKMKQNPLTLDH